MKLIFTKVALVSALILFSLSSKAQDNSAWSEVNTKQNETYFNQTYWKPKHYKQFVVNTEKLYKQLEAAPAYNSAAKTKNNYVVALPNAEGSFDEYYLEEVVIMEKALSTKYPEIKTYKGTSVKNPANQIRCSKTSLGFNAYIFGENTSYITTINRNNEQYIVYNKKDIEVTGNKMTCSSMDEVSDHEGLNTEQKNNIQKNIGTELRTYRLALACTKEYTNYHGGTVNGALAAMVTSVNRVNGVYEKEIDVSLTLVANTDLLICTNASTFTYTNNDGSTMLGENQSRVNSIIGAANYDIGHVFSTGGGGVAQQAMCKTAKARGVTGSSNPENDPFDIDYVAHEMGHQFGADHTFNSTTGSCSGNRVSFTAFEPGSGTTIMPYAGICGATNDIQPHSDAYFHSGSFDQIRDYIIFDVNSCGVKTPIANSIPVINNNSSSYTIPVGAKFRLGCDATDADGDVLTYCWEEMDLGPSGNWNAPSGNAPVFRSFNPTTNNFRYFPKQSTMLGGAQIKGEVMPNYARSMAFRCTVRDNKGGVIYTSGNTTVNTVATTSPFLVTTQNVNGITYNGGDEIQVDWDVAGTDAAPINASNVNIFLSIDGGQSFPYKIAENIANVGTGAAIIPLDIESTQARLIVEGADNVFFDVNDNDFEIVLVPSSVQEKSAVSKGITVFPNPTNGEVNIQIPESVNAKATLTITDIVGKQITVKNITIEKNNSIDMSTQEKGVYFVKVDTKDKSYLKKIVLQ